MTEHFTICPDLVEKCGTCEILFTRDLINNHDCFEELQKKLHAEDEIELGIKKSLGIDYNTVNAKCGRYHQLERCRGRILKDYREPVKCSGCEFTDLHMHDYYYRCN